MTPKNLDTIDMLFSKPIFNIGDTVTSKKLCLPVVGRVIEIRQPKCFINETLQYCNDDDWSYWDGIYPKWEKKYVYVVTSNTLITKGFHGTEKNAPIQNISYPEDDLEIF